VAIDTVAYDIGNVLIEWDVRALYLKVFEDPAEMEWFLSEVWRPVDNFRCDRGEPFATVIAERAEAHPAYADHLDLAWDRWIETVPGPVDGALRIVEQLAARGVRLYGLSNFSAETFPLVRHEYPVIALLNEVLISGEHAPMAKPDAEFFDLLCQRSDRSPEQILFVDDMELNTEAAAALGFAVHTFTDSESWAAALIEHGLLPPK